MARNTNGSGFSLKDHLFNAEKIEQLSLELMAAHPAFDAAGFTQAVMRSLPYLELKARVVHIAVCLEDYLNPDYAVALEQILTALPPPLDPHKTDNDFGDFIYAPYGEFVVRKGLKKKYLQSSLKALQQITMRFSMEDSIRYFITAHEDETLATLKKWTTHPHYQVRRLVSEGTRALLPWSGRLKLDPLLPLPLLSSLHADPTRYVTRSVANHLNDISKIDPEQVVATLAEWRELGQQDPKELEWITRHALRTLVKRGHPGALKLMGYNPKPRLKVSPIVIKKTTVRVGEAVEFSFSITASKTGKVMIDYVIDFVKANGKRTSKVYKIKSLVIPSGTTVEITKRHPFRKGSTTLTFYQGEHQVTVQINGQHYGTATFTLLT